MNTQQAKEALRAIAGAIVETVKEAGPQGAPSGHIYAALMAHGCTLNQYETIISTLVRVGMLKRSGHVLRIA